MLPSRARGQRGITLIEIILVSAIVAAAAAGLFVFAKKTSVTAAVEKEQRQVEDIVKTVDGLFSVKSSFADLGTNGASYLKDHAARTGLNMGTSSSGDPVLLTDIGSSKVIELRAELIPNPATPSVANGYSLRYQGLAPDECTRLVTAVAPITHGIRVGPRGHGPADPSSGVYVVERGSLSKSPSELAQACSNQEEVSLFFLPNRAIAATPTATAPPAARCNPVHEVQQTACPAGQLGSITQERDGTCTGPGNSMVYTAWTTTDNTCQDPPVAPPTITPPTTPDDCTIITSRRVQACPSGQIGQIVEESERDTCAGTSTAWTQVLNSCQMQPPGGTCTPTTEERTIACPAGQGGQIVQTRSSRCASPTAVPEWITPPLPDGWSTTSNTCTGSCVATGTCCTPIPDVPRDVPCPAGTYGSGGQEIRWLGCLNATTQSTTWSAWQPYRDQGASATCDACPATVTEPETTWSNRSAPCPTGQNGTNTWQAEQVRTRTVSYTCPAGTTALPTPTISAWSGWTDTGAIRNTVNTCAASPTATCASGPIMSGTGWIYNEAPIDNGVQYDRNDYIIDMNALPAACGVTSRMGMWAYSDIPRPWQARCACTAALHLESYTYIWGEYGALQTTGRAECIYTPVKIADFNIEEMKVVGSGATATVEVVDTVGGRETKTLSCSTFGTTGTYQSCQTAYFELSDGSSVQIRFGRNSGNLGLFDQHGTPLPLSSGSYASCSPTPPTFTPYATCKVAYQAMLAEGKVCGYWGGPAGSCSPGQPTTTFTPAEDGYIFYEDFGGTSFECGAQYPTSWLASGWRRDVPASAQDWARWVSIPTGP